VRYLATLLGASDQDVLRYFILVVAMLLDPAAGPPPAGRHPAVITAFITGSIARRRSGYSLVQAPGGSGRRRGGSGEVLFFSRDDPIFLAL
jgi:hypothetical protein